MWCILQFATKYGFNYKNGALVQVEQWSDEKFNECLVSAKTLH